MRTDSRRIVAIGGGGFSGRPADPELDRYVLGQCSAPTPRICLLPTASGDPDDQIQRFYRAFHELECEPSHVSLFRLGNRPVDLCEKLLAQHVIYVGGGSLANLLAIWRVHRLDELLHEAWWRGIVLCGISAGSMCWFRGGVTKSHGRPVAHGGLGFLPYSNSVHWTTEPERRAVYREAVRTGALPAGFGVDDGCALLFAGSRMVEAVRTPRSAGAVGLAEASEEPLDCVELDAPPQQGADLVSIEELRAVRRLQNG